MVVARAVAVRVEERVAAEMVVAGTMAAADLGAGRTAADLDIESRFTVLRVLEDERQKSETEEGFVCLCN